jgi:hypothetical protein
MSARTCRSTQRKQACGGRSKTTGYGASGNAASGVSSGTSNGKHDSEGGEAYLATCRRFVREVRRSMPPDGRTHSDSAIRTRYGLFCYSNPSWAGQMSPHGGGFAVMDRAYEAG